VPPLQINDVLRTAAETELADLARRDGLAGRSVEGRGSGVLAGLLEAAYPERRTGYDRIECLLESLALVPAISMVAGRLKAVGPPGSAWVSVLNAALNVPGRTEGSRTLDERRMALEVPDSLRQRFRTDKKGSATIRLSIWPEAYKVLAGHLMEKLESTASAAVTHFTEPQVARLALAELPESTQRHYYDTFLEQAPRTEIPSHRWLSPQQVQVQNRKRPIELEPLRALMVAFSSDVDLSPPTFLEHRYRSLLAEATPLSSQLNLAIKSGLSEAQEVAITELYRYLACLEAAVQAQPTDIMALDVVIVPGARRAMTYRVDKVIEILQLCDDPVVLFSGLHPMGASAAAAPVGEADAMRYYLFNVRGLDPLRVRLHVENRANNTFETLAHSIPILHAEAERRNRPLHIGLVTNPYHMRRLLLIAQRVLDLVPHLVRQVRCVTASSSIDLRALTSSAAGQANRRTYASQVYVQEYVKLIGGRGTGEF
jgi:hypothetical protein